MKTTGRGIQAPESYTHGAVARHLHLMLFPSPLKTWKQADTWLLTCFWGRRPLTTLNSGSTYAQTRPKDIKFLAALAENCLKQCVEVDRANAE